MKAKISCKYLPVINEPITSAILNKNTILKTNETLINNFDLASLFLEFK